MLSRTGNVVILWKAPIKSFASWNNTKGNHLKNRNTLMKNEGNLFTENHQNDINEYIIIHNIIRRWDNYKRQSKFNIYIYFFFWIIIFMEEEFSMVIQIKEIHINKLITVILNLKALFCKLIYRINNAAVNCVTLYSSKL